MSVGIEVAGWFAEAFIENLVKRVCSYISDRYNYKSNIKSKLKSLERDLRKIQAELHEADKRRIENPTLKDWLRDLKDAAYDAEDVFDMFDYKLLQEKFQVSSSASSRGLFKHVKSFIFYKDELTNRLIEVVHRFEKIVADMGTLIQLIRSEPTISENVLEVMKLRETSSMPIESQVIGRDSERLYLTKQLMLECKNVCVLPIVGIGGVGKTTLAQDVYNNESVKSHFDLMAWVCVSDDFDVLRLAKEIIESASICKPADFHNLVNFDRIQHVLKCGLAGKRFLIVLDDVWNEVASKWDKLQSILSFGKEGSKVIVTTRIRRIAEMMGTEKPKILGGLADKEYWRLFVQCAFGDKNPADHPDLVHFGREIAKKLGGNPLAAKTVGAVLKYELKVQHWREVSESKLWQANQQEDGIMTMLRLSYDYLPSHLKQCFVYCCLFPRGHKLSKEKLIGLWMAHGFLLPNEHKNILEKIGETYITELSNRSFFQKSKSSYVIHDLLHNLAENLSDGEILIAEKRVEIPARVRHLSICAKDLSLLCNGQFAKEKLRSLVVFDCCEESLDLLKEYEGLRVLVLENFRGKLSSQSIQKMHHLRYLEIEDYERRCSHKLPESLNKLYHLQVLNVGERRQRWTGSSRVLPEEINRLVKLRHLKASLKGVLGIGALTSIQELRFDVNQGKIGFEIKQLRDMPHLRKLEMTGLESVASKAQASEAMLENKEHLKKLKLYWKDDHTRMSPNDNKVLDGLQPHQNLEKLEIRGYGGGNIPGWWNGNWLSNLKKVRLVAVTKWEILPPMGQLPFLKVLRLEQMNSVERIGSEFYGSTSTNTSSLSFTTIFPSLEKLCISAMCELKEWYFEVKEGVKLFPRLSHLRVIRCPQLRGSSFDFLSSQIRQLSVVITKDNSPLFIGRRKEAGGLIEVGCLNALILLEWIPFQTLASIESLYFSAREITTFPTELEEWFQHLTSLRSLCFYRCSELEYMPSNLINRLPTLQELSFERCDKIKSLPEEGLPPSLQVFRIFNCSKLEEQCMKDGPDWHKSPRWNYHLRMMNKEAKKAADNQCLEQPIMRCVYGSCSSSKQSTKRKDGIRVMDDTRALFSLIKHIYVCIDTNPPCRYWNTVASFAWICVMWMCGNYTCLDLCYVMGGLLSILIDPNRNRKLFHRARRLSRVGSFSCDIRKPFPSHPFEQCSSVMSLLMVALLHQWIRNGHLLPYAL